MSVRLFCVFRGYLLFVDFLQQLVEFLLADRLGVVESLGCGCDGVAPWPREGS